MHLCGSEIEYLQTDLGSSPLNLLFDTLGIFCFLEVDHKIVSGTPQNSFSVVRNGVKFLSGRLKALEPLHISSIIFALVDKVRHYHHQSLIPTTLENKAHCHLKKKIKMVQIVLCKYNQRNGQLLPKKRGIVMVTVHLPLYPSIRRS